MWKILVIVLMAVLLPLSVWASPFLACDPQANTDEFIVNFNGVEETVTYNEQSGVVILKDLAGIADGNHSVTVRAKNIWGESSDIPFAFSKELPGSPSGIALSP